MTPLVLNFGTGVWSGWGVVGLNLMGQLALDTDFEVQAPLAKSPTMFTGIDPYHYRLLQQVMSRPITRGPQTIEIQCVGNDLRAFESSDSGTLIGRVIIEKPDVHAAMEGLAPFQHLLTGSTWCKNLIEEISGREAHVIHEGIDPSIFRPQQKSGWFGETFNIYSAGKVEYRKGQDLVLKAFKIFCERHGDARLITIWNSPFSDLGNGFKGTLDYPLKAQANGLLDVAQWAHDNGIDASKVMELGCVPNWMLPQVLKEMDCALFPSRIESCTCLPAMEAMACGVPTITPKHSGMLDLPRCDLELTSCKPIHASSEYFFPKSDLDWYECDVDEIVEMLEWIYTERKETRRRALEYSEWIRRVRTWKRHADKLKAWLFALSQQQRDNEAIRGGVHASERNAPDRP